MKTAEASLNKIQEDHREYMLAFYKKEMSVKNEQIAEYLRLMETMTDKLMGQVRKNQLQSLIIVELCKKLGMDPSSVAEVNLENKNSTPPPTQEAPQESTEEL